MEESVTEKTETEKTEKVDVEEESSTKDAINPYSGKQIVEENYDDLDDIKESPMIHSIRQQDNFIEKALASNFKIVNAMQVICWSLFTPALLLILFLEGWTNKAVMVIFSLVLAIVSVLSTICVIKTHCQNRNSLDTIL